MKSYRLFLWLILVGLWIVGCDDNIDKKVCPQCRMPISQDSKNNTAHIKNKVYFDDVGCMILWTKKHKIDPKEAFVFAKDTKKYIKAKDAHYSINERTPMGYGFSAYENPKEGSIDFEEMKLRMLRGETMKNPKIRKQILGY